jgi:hypothetical protein
MDFLKKHYEKVLLGLVLLGLAGAVAFLPFKIASEKQKLADLRDNLTHPKVKDLPPLDLSIPEGELKRLAAPARLDLSTTNRVFNSMPWQKTVDGRMIPYDDSHVGPKALSLVRTAPLYTILSFDNVTLSDQGPRYVIGVTREAATKASDRSKHQMGCPLHGKTEVFALTDAKGPPENPTQLNLIMNDSGESAVLTHDRSFKRVDGYLADLKYEPEKRTWLNQRVNATLHFNGEDYKIVAITANEAVVLGPSGKKTTIPLSNAAP